MKANPVDFPMTNFIERHQDQFDDNNLLGDLSQEQRIEYLWQALNKYSISIHARDEQTAKLKIVAGESKIYLPLDYVYNPDYSLQSSLGYNDQSNIFSFLGGDAFGSALGASRFRPLTNTSPIPSKKVIPTTDTNRRWYIPLSAPATISYEFDITYRAKHQIQDRRKTLTLESQPLATETLLVGSTEYVFTDATPGIDEIKIGTTLAKTLKAIYVRTYEDQEDNGAVPHLIESTIELESFTAAQDFDLETTSVGIVIDEIPGINTVDTLNESKLFRMFMGYICLAYSTGQLVKKSDNTASSASWLTLSNAYFATVKNSLTRIGTRV